MSSISEQCILFPFGGTWHYDPWHSIFSSSHHCAFQVAKFQTQEHLHHHHTRFSNIRIDRWWPMVNLITNNLHPHKTLLLIRTTHLIANWLIWWWREVIMPSRKKAFSTWFHFLAWLYHPTTLQKSATQDPQSLINLSEKSLTANWK